MIEVAKRLNADRDLLRARWRGEGWHRQETVAERLQRAARERPDTSILFHTEMGLRRSSTREIVEQGQRLAGALLELGIRPGDVIACQLPTRYETAALYVAAFFCGAVLLPIVHIYGPTETGFILRRSHARMLIVPDFWRKKDYLERLPGLGSTPDLEYVIVVGERCPAGARRFADLEALGSKAVDAAHGDADQVCLLLFTSGTTGDPKGVQHTHNTVRCEWEIPYLEDQGLFLNPSPAGHIQGFNFLLRPMICGVPMLMMDRWNPLEAANLIASLGVMQSGGAPYFLMTLLEAAKTGGYDLSSLKSFGLGGAAVTTEHIELAERNGILSGRAYGLTEHSTVTAWRSAMSLHQRATSEGRLQPGSELRIVDDDDRDLPSGIDGEVLLRGPEQFIGYLDPQHDQGCYAPGAWFRTGDIGHYSADGHLSITDRKKDLIIRGGENISSMEVEGVLMRHPAIADVAVVGMHDLRYGERVCACVVLRPGATLSLQAVVAHCVASGFARQKTPEALVLLHELPRTPSGKVKKAELRLRVRDVG